jgi:hypothetical protein
MAQANVKVTFRIDTGQNNNRRFLPLPRKKQTNVDRFYEWLIKCGNVHLSNDEQVVNAFNKIPI